MRSKHIDCCNLWLCLLEHGRDVRVVLRAKWPVALIVPDTTYCARIKLALSLFISRIDFIVIH